VLSDVRQAVAKDAPKAAGPILDKAVKDKKITKAQADSIRQRITQLAQGGGPGRGGF
jgi:3-hydroxyacyl-CoA dehydrogenase